MPALITALGLVGSQGHVVAELGELADESAGLAGLADAIDEVIGAEIPVGRLADEDVPDGHQDRVFNGDEGSLLATVADQASDLGSQVGVLRPSGGCCGDAEDRRAGLNDADIQDQSLVEWRGGDWTTWN